MNNNIPETLHLMRIIIGKRTGNDKVFLACNDAVLTKLLQNFTERS